MTTLEAAAGSIAVLATGGTIAQAGTRDATLSVDDLVAGLPRDGDLPPLRCEQVFQVASPDMTPTHWATLAARLDGLLRREDVWGAVVTHGTDTLEETAYYLHLVLDTNKPVVVVGSMRSAERDGADGPANLRGAIAVAASPEAVGKGVLVTLNDRIESARDVSKTHTTALDAFRSPGTGPIGAIDRRRVRFERQPLRLHTVASAFAGFRGEALPRVDVAYVYAGVGREAVDAPVAAGAKGIVLAGTGNGSVPRALEAALADARREGVVVVRSSRTNGGAVGRNAEHDDDRLDLVTADDLNPQKARVLLMLSLARTDDTGLIQAFFDQH